MGSFLAKLLGYNKQPKLRILLLGLDSAGKTTILYALKCNEPVSTVPTIGFNVETVEYNSITLNIWDVGGQDKLRPLWRHYYRGTSGVIFVVDSNDTERLDLAKQELQFLMNEVELKGSPLLVVANKQDLPNALTPEQIAERLEVTKISNLHHVLGTVARKNQGLDECMDWLSKNMEPI